MTLAELEEELEGASERNETSLQISLIDTMLRKTFGPKKLQLQKKLVVLYREKNKNTELLELAPQVLRVDPSDIELRLYLIKMYLSSAETILLA